MRDQFAQYVIVDDIKINSKLTSGEDVADLGGTLLAYQAWKKDVAGKYRINGIVANPPEFGRAFSCKASSPMAREKPCKVW